MRLSPSLRTIRVGAFPPSMAKAAAGEAQSLVVQHGMQSFGAMGFTWENDLQFAIKRASAGELMFGGAAEHRAVIAKEYRAADF